MIQSPRMTGDGRYAVLRIRKSSRDLLEKHLFQRYPDREWGTFFRFGFRRTTWGLALTWVDPILPGSGDLDRQSGATVFKDQYTLRAMRTAEQRELAIGVAHSHPAGYLVRPSRLDDDMDQYFAKEIAAYGAGSPYLSLIFQRSDKGGFTFSGRVHDRGEWFPMTKLLTVGDKLQSEMAEGQLDRLPSSQARQTGDGLAMRLENLIGSPGINRLKSSCVGVIGCGGTGTPGIGVMARAGVGEFVIVDPKRLSPSNLERVHGAIPNDLESNPLPYKVELQRRHIQSINPMAKVTALVGNLLQDNVLDELLRCDVLLGATDSIHGRVALSDFAKHFLLPSIDVGVQMEGRDMRISNQTADFTVYSPESPCAFCYDLIDTTEMATELMSDEERTTRLAAAQEAVARGDDPDHYWTGIRQIQTVGYLTTMVGSLAAGYIEGWLTGAFSIPHTAFQFDVGRPRLGFTPTAQMSQVCACRAHIGWSDQARSFRNTARPKHWPPRALLLSREG